MSSAGSGMHKLTYQSRLGIQEEGPEGELKQGVSDRGGIQSCSTGHDVETDMVFSTKACKPILVVNQNKRMNLKMSIIRLL